MCCCVTFTVVVLVVKVIVVVVVVVVVVGGGGGGGGWGQNQPGHRGTGERERGTRSQHTRGTTNAPRLKRHQSIKISTYNHSVKGQHKNPLTALGLITKSSFI